MKRHSVEKTPLKKEKTQWGKATEYKQNIKDTDMSGGKPPTRSPKERVPGHRPVPGHLLVVRVLQKNLTKMFSKLFSSDVEQRKRFSHPDHKKVVFGISDNSVFQVMFNFFDILARSGAWGVESILPFLKLTVLLLVQNGIWVMGMFFILK